MVDNKVYMNPWVNDRTLLCFCRSTKFDADKVIEKYQKNLEFRTKYKLDTCIGIEYPELV